MNKPAPHRDWTIRIDESLPVDKLTELGLDPDLPRNQWLTVPAPTTPAPTA